MLYSLEFRRWIVTLGFLVVCSVSAAQEPPITIDLSNDAARAETVTRLRIQSEKDVAEAEDFAIRNGMPIRGTNDQGQYFEIIKIENGRPMYYITENSNAAISTAADKVRDTSPFNVDGAGVMTGVWDGGSVLSTHQEFGGRVNVKDGAASHYHATHVGGTIAASGVVASAEGMAPGTTIESYKWDFDESEMASRAATTSSISTGTEIYHSNHSYGYVTGWTTINYSGNGGWHFLGTFSDGEDRDFGRYSYQAVDWDTIAYNAAYYLIIKSAGNDRGDGPPSEGETFYYLNGGWVSKAYSSATDPPADGGALGYDSISHAGNAKNILTVAASNDAVSGGVRNVSVGMISSFSGFGPSDDGRVKPDIAANGVGLYSTYNTNDSSYASLSGTSMSAPNVTGSATLLIDYYRGLFSNANMRASMLKGLIIHTATEIGNTGPDYIYGWGYMDTETAANHIKAHSESISANTMVDGTLNGANPTRSYTYTWDGSSPIRATIVWTDPAGTSLSGLNDTSPRLINDLDLQLRAPDGSTVYFPYVLNVASPSSAATTGDNTVDNVEQVYLAAPAQAGTYTVEISHKNSLTNSSQVFSLLVSGVSTTDMSVTPANDLTSSGEEGGSFSPVSETYTVENTGGVDLSWTAAKTQSWLTLSSLGGTLTSGSSTGLLVSINSNADALDFGEYTDTVTITDTTNGISVTRDVTLTINEPGVHNSSDIPKSIVDFTTVTSTIVVADSATILDINVTLDITHTYDEDLDVTLQSPNGTFVELFTYVGGSGDNFTGTTLDDEAGTSIASGSAPFSTSYQPEGVLSSFDGEDGIGTWTLYVTDDAGEDEGTLNSWSIRIESYGPGPTDIVFVDFNNSGFENGESGMEWNSLSEALAVVDADGVVKIMGDSAVTGSSETMTIDQDVNIQSENGTVSIGVAP